MSYIFNPKEHSDDFLWELVLQREEFEDAGVIGDCLLRELAEQEAEGGPVIMRMELIGYKSALELLRRQRPDKFKDDYWDASEPCPDCGTQLKCAPGGGVKCPNKDCGYWFCY